VVIVEDEGHQEEEEDHAHLTKEGKDAVVCGVPDGGKDETSSEDRDERAGRCIASGGEA
jgi:hypothetical protein